MTSRFERAANYAVLFFFSAVALFPLVGVVLEALTPSTDAGGGFAVPTSLDPGNFVTAWTQGHFGSYLQNSLLVTTCVVFASAVLSVLAGYAFGTMRFRGATVLFYVLLAGMMLPEEALLVPLYFDLRGAGVTDTYWSLILPQIATALPFGVFWMRSYFRSVERGLVEAARIDGANSWRILWGVLVPMGRPALTTMCLFVGMWTWNSFLLPLIMVSKPALNTVPLGLIFFQGRYNVQYNLMAAASVLVALPVIGAYIATQRHFVAGMMAGSLKG
ncbi:MAG: carbohydrate ABC transporter permease [Nocardioidaceae bacterium]